MNKIVLDASELPCLVKAGTTLNFQPEILISVSHDLLIDCDLINEIKNLIYDLLSSKMKGKK